MYCTACGFEVPDGTNYCTKCGTPMSAEARRQSEVIEQTVSQSPLRRWFEFRTIRDERQLSSEQIVYLRSGSITIFGPFNVFARWHWDMIVAGFILNFASELLAEFNVFTVFNFAVLAGYVFLLVYMYRHGRRLAWNRVQWETFGAFQASEKKWKPWGWVGIALIALSNIVVFLAP